MLPVLGVVTADGVLVAGALMHGVDGALLDVDAALEATCNLLPIEFRVLKRPKIAKSQP